MTNDSDSSRLARVLFGGAGFERAAVWSAAGFGVSYVTFDIAAIAADALTALGVMSPSVAASATALPVALTVAAIAVIGVAAFAATGGGVVPAALLAYGPLAAALLRTIGPTPYALPVDEGLSMVVAIGGPLAITVAGAVAVGGAGFAVGRAIAGTGTDDDETADSPSTPEGGSNGASATADD